MSTPPLKISAVIITLNEEKNIARCIKSLLPIVDEVIVWDAHSTDRTKEISESLGAKVFQHAWEGYSVSKNKANEKATGDYILSIDADEELSADLKASLKHLKPILKEDAYVFVRINNYCGTWIRYSGWYPEYKTRLFRNGKAKWVGEIHEWLEFNGKPEFFIIPGDLLHYSILSVEHHVQKIFLYSRLTAQKDYQNGVRPSILFHGVLKPGFHFFKNFFLQRGFLDGYKGFVIARMAAFERFLRYVKLKEFYKIGAPAPQNPRVLQLSSEATWRGGEQQIAYLIDELRLRGIESVAIVKSKSNFETHCREKGIRFYSLPFQNSIDLFSSWKLMRIARKEGASIVHIHSSKSHSIATLATLFGLRAPMILSRRVDFELSDSWFSKWKYNHSSIKKIVCVSEAIAKIVSPHLKNPQKCITVHSGVDIKKFQLPVFENLLRREYKVSDDVVLIGNTSALAGHKDYFTFIDTLEILKKENLPIKGFIIGKGPLEKDLKEYVDKKGMKNDIIFTGFRNNITQLLPSLDIFLITSTEEGLGTSVLDAFASRVPVVATAAGGIPEMVKDEVTGFLCQPKDVSMLATKIKRLMDTPLLRKQLVENAYTSLSNFSKEKTAEQTLAIYREIAPL